MIFVNVCGCTYARVFKTFANPIFTSSVVQVCHTAYTYELYIFLSGCGCATLYSMCVYQFDFHLTVRQVVENKFHLFISYHYRSYLPNHAPTHDDILAGVILPAHQQLVHR